MDITTGKHLAGEGIGLYGPEAQDENVQSFPAKIAKEFIFFV